MERIVKQTTEDVTLIPQAEGWAVWVGSRREHIVTSLAEAAALLSPKRPVHLALPSQGLIIERLQLPATERDELAGMVRLQWEKMLPFPPEEVSGDFAIVVQGDKESTVLTVAAANPALDLLCQPLRAREVRIAGLAPSVCHVAAACPAGETVLAVYVELGELVVAVVENRRAGWVHVFPWRDTDRFASELPQLLLAASLEGVPASFTQILIAPEAAGCEPSFRQYFEAPTGPLPALTSASDAPMDLLPAAWRSQAAHRQRRQKTSRQMALAAAVYGLAILAGWTHLWFLRRAAAKLDADLAALRPKLEQIQAHQARSQALAPAIDPRRYAIELLYLIQRAVPSGDVRLTEFDQALAQWRIVGEAPSATLAVQYVARLKEEPALSDTQITAGPPQLVAGERAQFSIFGKP
jgi:hypothetical protein